MQYDVSVCPFSFCFDLRNCFTVLCHAFVCIVSIADTIPQTGVNNNVVACFVISWF